MEYERLKNIYYFVDERGGNPVKEFIRALPLGDRAKIFACIVELTGWVRWKILCHCKPEGRSNLNILWDCFVASLLAMTPSLHYSGI